MSAPVPVDEEAEQALAGAAVWSREAAVAVLAAVDPAAFYLPWCGRVVAAGAELVDDVTPNEIASGRNVRLGALSVTADVDLRRLGEWRAMAWTLRQPEPLARRVRDAAERRRLMLFFSEAFAALGAGVPIDVAVAPLRDEIVRAA